MLIKSDQKKISDYRFNCLYWPLFTAVAFDNEACDFGAEGGEEANCDEAWDFEAEGGAVAIGDDCDCACAVDDNCSGFAVGVCGDGNALIEE